MVTELQKLLLEEILQDKDLKEYLPQDVMTDGLVEVLGSSRYRDYDKPDVFEIAVRFKIRNDVADEGSSEFDERIKNYRPELLSNLNCISESLKEYRPFLFTAGVETRIVSQKKTKKLLLPLTVTHECDHNGNDIKMGLSDFKMYWGITSEGNIEMALFPKHNDDLLSDDLKKFLSRQYENESGIVHYNNGLDISNLPLKECRARLSSHRSPFVIVKVDKEFVVRNSSLDSTLIEGSKDAEMDIHNTTIDDSPKYEQTHIECQTIPKDTIPASSIKRKYTKREGVIYGRHKKNPENTIVSIDEKIKDTKASPGETEQKTKRKYTKREGVIYGRHKKNAEIGSSNDAEKHEHEIKKTYPNGLRPAFNADEEFSILKRQDNNVQEEKKDYVKILHSYYPEDINTRLPDLLDIMISADWTGETIKFNVEGSRMIVFKDNNKLRSYIGLPSSLYKDITDIERTSGERIDKFAMLFCKEINDKPGMILVPEQNYRLLGPETKKGLSDLKTIGTFSEFKELELNFPFSEHHGLHAKFLSNNEPFIMLNLITKVSKYRAHVFEYLKF